MTRAFIAFKIPAILFAALLLAVSLHGCKGTVMQSSWTSSPITIDGKTNDWNDIPAMADEKNGITFKAANDSENVYVLFALTEPFKARSIRMRGMTIWIDRNGKKDKNFGIKFIG